MAQIVYLNGDFLPINEARVSVLDRGFLFGDGVYEVVPIYNGKTFQLDEHIARLQHSLDAIKLEVQTAAIDFVKIIASLLELNNAIESQDYSLYIEVTRGPAEERAHAFPGQVSPTIFLMLKPLKPLIYEELQCGKKAITHQDIRWQYCHIKSISLLPNVLLYQAALNSDCDETILIRDGLVVEGTSSNVFMVKNGVVFTPPLSQERLSGVTRSVILKILQENSLPFYEQNITVEQLFTADEVWISSSTRSIFPIVVIDGRIIGDGKAGAIWQKVMQLYLIRKR